MKKAIFLIILVVLFISLIQFWFQVIAVRPLDGHIDVTNKPKGTIEKWFNGEYQEEYGDFFNDHIGFRPFFIRGFNQLQFDLFDKANKKVAVKGDNGVLYDDRYIKTTLGEDFLGVETINKKVKRIELLKRNLETENKKLLIVIAPNKSRYYKNEIPNYYKKIDSTNYEVFLKLFHENNIDFIDFNKWFVNQKDKREHNLIPKYGIHWSNYGAFLAADSIIRYCNTRYRFSLPNFVLDSLVVSKTPIIPDYDIGKALNLWTTLNDENYIYPFYSVAKDSNSIKKNLLVISDSFFEQMYSTKFSFEVFNSTHFWYYNREVREENNRERKEEDLIKTIPKIDLVIIMMTEWNLYRIGFGIVEEINSFYSGETIESKEVRLYLDRIRSDKSWFKKVKDQAKETGVSVDSMLILNAKHMATIKENK